jgi:hypothetical protein
VLLCVVAASLVTGVPAQAQTVTAASVAAETTTLIDEVAAQWAGLQLANGVFPNTFPADLARGHGSFVTPLMAYAIHRSGQRSSDPRLTAAAELAWPLSVHPSRASAFDMVGAAYAYRNLNLSPQTSAFLADYQAQYRIPLNGYTCISTPGCYSNLRLVDALAVLAMTSNRIVSPYPDARLADPVAARTAAAAIVNRRIPRVVDHRLRARGSFGALTGSVLSDPPVNQTAYHALSAFMLSLAIDELGAEASPQAHRALAEVLDALAVLVGPNGDVSYVGRGQGQVWVPGLTAGAMVAGARLYAATDPARAGRYLAVARRAVERLRALHLNPVGGFLVVPGVRLSTAGIDPYAHTVAYNGLAMFGLTVAADIARTLPPIPVGPMPAEGRLTVRDPAASALAVLSTGDTWMAVRRASKESGDMRHDFGLHALQIRAGAGWRQLVAPRAYTKRYVMTAGPSTYIRSKLAVPVARRMWVSGRTVHLRGGFRRVGNRRTGRRTVQRGVRYRFVALRSSPLRAGARVTVSGLRPGRWYRLLAFTAQGTGGWSRRRVQAFDAVWRFSVPIRVRRRHGYHSAQVEYMDALAVRVRAPRSGRFSYTITG